MELNREQVKAIAKLAAIQLDDAEVNRFVTELSHILDHIDQLKEVNIEGVAPTNQVTGLTSVTRPDVVVEFLDRQALLDTFPETENGLLKLQNKKP
ncbi:MAG: Asp-tRNA(Asn)/Glu-tRNA(Gln) amidotransferase subunit GatC [Patescibacteria group bacterium]